MPTVPSGSIRPGIPTLGVADGQMLQGLKPPCASTRSTTMGKNHNGDDHRRDDGEDRKVAALRFMMNIFEWRAKDK
jgi:hypothetical protein